MRGSSSEAQSLLEALIQSPQASIGLCGVAVAQVSVTQVLLQRLQLPGPGYPRPPSVVRLSFKVHLLRLYRMCSSHHGYRMVAYPLGRGIMVSKQHVLNSSIQFKPPQLQQISKMLLSCILAVTLSLTWDAWPWSLGTTLAIRWCRP